MKPHEADAIAKIILALLIIVTLWGCSKLFPIAPFLTPNPDLPANFK